MNTKREVLDLEEAYGQNPICFVCGACILDGPTPDAEFISLSGYCEE